MEKLLVTVSGGRSSAYMAIRLQREYADKYEMYFVYANTGQEHIKTIEFLRNLTTHFGIHLHILEADVNQKRGVGTGYKERTWDTLDTKGKVFTKVIKKYGLPTHGYMHCTRELKIRPMDAFMKNHNIKLRTLGIRYDEPRRYKPTETVLYPLWEWEITKQDVLDFWGEQEFDLEIPDHLGNCTWCYKKSDKNLNLLVADHPKVFKFPLKMEKKYPHPTRKIFRGWRTTQNVLDGVEGEKYEDECAEECGSVLV